MTDICEPPQANPLPNDISVRPSATLRDIALAYAARDARAAETEEYLSAIYASLDHDNLDEAERISIDARTDLPKSLPLYLVWAEIGEASGDQRFALNRWDIIISKFPKAVEGYENGARAALALGEYRKLAEICKLAPYSESGWIRALEVPQKAAPELLKWACEPGEVYNYLEGLRRCAVFQAFFPELPEGWLESAKCCLGLRLGAKAEKICLDALEHIAPSVEILSLLAESCWLQKKNTAAVNYASLACDLGSGKPGLAEDFIYKFLAHGALEDAKQLFESAKQDIKDDCAKARIKLAINLRSAPGKIMEHLAAFAESYEPAAKIGLPLGWNTRLYMNTLAKLAPGDKNAARRHRSLMQSLILPMRDTGAAPGRRRKKLCIFDGASSLSYMSAVIRNIPPEEIDIVARAEPYSQEFLDSIGLGSYACYGRERYGDYQYAITDANMYANSPYKAQPGQQMICYWHGSDAIGARIRPGMGAFILPFQNSAEFYALLLAGDEYKLLPDIPKDKRCEITYTGPFHIERPRLDRRQLRAKIEEDYGIALPADKPLVFILHSECIPDEHYIYAANRIAEYATVLFKPLDIFPESARKRLDSRIALVSKRLMADNTLRFAADFIMAEFMGGSCTSSLMLGLPVMPFYSRVCEHKFTPGKYHPRLYQNYFYSPGRNEFIGQDINPKLLLLNYLRDHNLLFDILDSARIRDTILSNSLEATFAPHLPLLQLGVFGSYFQDDAARQTAERIRYFANHGTFGKDCAALMFHA